MDALQHTALAPLALPRARPQIAAGQVALLHQSIEGPIQPVAGEGIACGELGARLGAMSARVHPELRLARGVGRQPRQQQILRQGYGRLGG